MRRALVCLSVAVCAALSPPPLSAQVETARSKGLAYLVTHQRGDGTFASTSGLEVQTTAAAVEALANAGMKPSQSVTAAIAWLGNQEATSVDSWARRIVALNTVGIRKDSDLIKLLDLRNRTGRASWGAYPGYASSFPDMPLGWMAIRETQYLYTDSGTGTNQTDELRLAVFCEALPSQLVDGSWAYISSTSLAPPSAATGAIVPTALTLHELNASAATIGATGSCGGPVYTLSTAINNGLSWLLTKRNASDGGFGEGGVSGVLETAVIYRFLKSLSSPPEPATSGALTYLLNQQDGTTGAWRGDVFQTALVLATFPVTSLADTDKDGIPDAVETLIGKNPATPDSRGLVPGNADSVAGVTVPVFLAPGQTQSSFSQNLSGSGGAPPYTFILHSGQLPDGLSLSPSGVISGTPTVVGEFSFDYIARDTAGNEVHGVRRIDITQGPVQIPALPEWAALALAALLAAMMARAHGLSSRRRR
jgi:hypothetical protein